MFILCSLKNATDWVLLIVPQCSVLARRGRRSGMIFYWETNLMCKTVIWRTFRYFWSCTSLIKSRLPSLPLHAGEQCRGTQGGARPSLCHCWLWCGSLWVAFMASSFASGEDVLAEPWPTGHGGDVPCVASVFPPPHQKGNWWRWWSFGLSSSLPGFGPFWWVLYPFLFGNVFHSFCVFLMEE